MLASPVSLGHVVTFEMAAHAKDFSVGGCMAISRPTSFVAEIDEVRLRCVDGIKQD